MTFSCVSNYFTGPLCVKSFAFLFLIIELTYLYDEIPKEQTNTQHQFRERERGREKRRQISTINNTYYRIYSTFPLHQTNTPPALMTTLIKMPPVCVKILHTTYSAQKTFLIKQMKVLHQRTLSKLDTCLTNVRVYERDPYWMRKGTRGSHKTMPASYFKRKNNKEKQRW